MNSSEARMRQPMAIGLLLPAVSAAAVEQTPLPQWQIPLATVVALALPFVILTAFLGALAVRAWRNKVITGADGLLGEVGIAASEVAPEGTVFVHGEYWNAVSRTPVPAGARVRVTSIDRLKLTVQPA